MRDLSLKPRFFHGYSVLQNEEEFRILRAHILAAKPPGKLYLLFWKSSHWIVPVAVALLKMSLRVMRRGKLLNPAALTTDFVYSAALYKVSERRAENLGRQLKDFIAINIGQDPVSINLVGHSLGARIIYCALADTDWLGYRIRDCVFLGGAADLQAEGWARCAKKVEGTIFNAYSRRDLALLLTPDSRRRIGRHPLYVPDYAVVNREYSWGYWPKLKHVLPDLWRASSSFSAAGLDVVDISDSRRD